MSKILFFIVGNSPTTDEQAEINRLNVLATAAFSEVGVRTAEESTLYGLNIEASDYVAGAIPTEYNAVTNYGEIDEDRPVQMDVLPATADVAAAATQQLQVIKVTGDDMLNLTTTDVTAVTTTYASDDEGVATVDAAGEVTGVAAGTCEITATHTYATAKTSTAISTITVPA